MDKDFGMPFEPQESIKSSEGSLHPQPNGRKFVSYSGLKTGAFSSPEQICFRIRDLPGPPGQPTCADESQRSLSCRNVGLRSARDGLKSCFSRSLSGKSLAEPYRISIKRFTARVPEMPKYAQRWI
jgi:hypothetical protein